MSIHRKMLAPSSLTSLGRDYIIYYDKHKEYTQLKVATNLRHAFLCLLTISEALSYTWHVQWSLHSSWPMIFYIARTPIPEFIIPAISLPPRRHSSHSAKSGQYKNCCSEFGRTTVLTLLLWGTYLACSHLQSQWH